MKLLLSFFITLISFFCFSQEEVKEDLLVDTKRNTLYLELGGSGALYSVNYDRILTKNKYFATSFSVGATYWEQNYKGSFSYYSNLYGMPISFNFLVGKKNHQFESGIGISEFYGTAGSNFYIMVDEEKSITTMLSLKLGYRYQRPTGGMFFRATFTPLIQGWEYKSIKIIKDDFDVSNINTVKTEVDKIGFIPWAGISIGYTLKK